MTAGFAPTRSYGRVAFSLEGSGPALVFPAWWVSHLERDAEDPLFRRFFDTLAERFTVVRYDRPGVGLSDRGQLVGALADDVEVLSDLMGHLGIGRTHLFGFSAGGPVAVSFAARSPERVERLVLYGTYLDGRDLGTAKVQQAVLGLVRAHWGLGSRTLSDIFIPSASSETIERYVARQRAASDGEVAAALLHLMYTVDAAADASALTAPVLVAHRRGDRAVPMEAGRRLAAAIRGASFVTFDGAAHPPWEGGDVLDAALAFFTGGEVASSGAGIAACRLDHAARELLLEGRRVPLTALEHALLAHLIARPGQAVARDQLIAEVWKQRVGGSNVVDAVVRTLRKKLGPYARSIETVKGRGYRFDRFHT